jgi:hypothetical protein
MGSELAHKTQSDQLTFQEIKDMGTVFLNSGFFSDIKDASQAVVKIMYGGELGLSPITSLMSIHIIKGKPELSTNLLATLVKKSERYDYRVKTLNDQECVIEFTQDGKFLGESAFSMNDAKRASLVNPGSGWTKFPKAMLFARAISQGVRTYTPDVSSGVPVYSDGEISGDPIVEAPAAAVGPMVIVEPPVIETVEVVPDEAVLSDFSTEEIEVQLKKLQSSELPDLLDSGQMVNFSRSFKDACPEDMSAEHIEEARHGWLKAQGYVDTKGNGTSKAIPKAGWIKVRNQASKFAATLHVAD